MFNYSFQLIKISIFLQYMTIKEVYMLPIYTIIEEKYI